MSRATQSAVQSSMVSIDTAGGPNRRWARSVFVNHAVGASSPTMCGRRPYRSRPCSTGPPIGSPATWRALARRPNSRCAMGVTEALVQAALTQADVPGALALSNKVGWNQTADDWRLFIAHGRTIGLFDGDDGLVATGAALPYDNGFGYISM